MLSIKIAEEELGLEIIRNDGNDRPSQSPRHRIIHCGRDKFNHSTNQDKNIVSLIFHGGGDFLDNVSSSYWKSFEILSLLDMEDFGVKTLSETISTLMELRYLGLRNNYIQEIPHSFGGLKKLEVFDIALNFLVEVPDIIKEMVSLNHLYMSDVICPNPLKVDFSQNLETLTYISINDWTYEVIRLKWMSRLRKLGIEEIDENSVVSNLFPSLSKLENFRHLTLRGFRFRSMAYLDEIGVLDNLYKLRLDGRLARLPRALKSLKKLLYLVLVNTCLDEDPMQLLKKLRYLRGLKLQNAYTGSRMVIEEDKLQYLEILRINELWNMSCFTVGKRGICRLEELEIKNCPRLETLPEQIGSIFKMRKLKMVTTKRIATKIRNSSFISNTTIMEVDISP
ncbi:disease resistance protein RPH8A-like [Salvia hispanica]|uniref:disease resistance protein RPH8A-like n=1 Tax=Salvia hispanica TaxID=49212 RepID=UPI0020091CEC|nr:disease resistance protein RPH8A-like [Salvia hispanica]